MSVSSARSWWQDGVVYQVYVRSFGDSDGDGVGDLPGIRARLPYLAGLGVDALWLTPFYRSPMADHGYDVADHTDVDPLFGTLADLDGLLADAHRLGLKVLVDLVPNHTSSAHAWFTEALAEPASPKRAFYIFRPPGPGGGPPNNWESVFGGPAWSLDEASGEYYLHLFDAGQPDLDWRNPAVHQAWEQILYFWLDRGVDGFRIDVAHGLYKDLTLRDNPEHGPIEPGAELFHAGWMPHAWDQPEVVEVFRRWREITDTYDDRVMVGEVFLDDLDKVARYVGRDRLHQSFNFVLVAAPFDAGHWKAVIHQALQAFSIEGASPTWVLSNHDVIRHPTRYGGGAAGQRRARAATATLLALPGAPYVYQGEELGLEQSDVPEAQRQDPMWLRSGGQLVGRDGSRTPIPWTTQEPDHGWTTGVPWLPFGAGAGGHSVEAEDTDPDSMLAFYRRALALRRELRPGLAAEVCWLDAPGPVLAFRRIHADGRSLRCVLNTGPVDIVVPEATGCLVLTSGSTPPRDGVVPAETTLWLLG